MRANNALWLGFAVPDELAHVLFTLDPQPAVQTHKFGWSFVRALKHAFMHVTLVSSCPVQSFPLVRRIVFRRAKFNSQGVNGVQLGFVNIILLKHLTRLVACFITAYPIIKKERVAWIFVHGVHIPYLIFGLLARVGGCRIAVVLTDPPGVVLPTDGSVAKYLKSIDDWLTRRLLRRMDAVVALAPNLVNSLAPGCPSLVFPGILDSTLEVQQVRCVSARDEGAFTVVYAGTLSKAYGVDRLLDAIAALPLDSTVRLKLYGRGDQEDRIRQVSEFDSRVIYGGFLDTAHLYPELCAADLLINPRPTSEFFASMSFPSKLIEYLSTGRPVLTTCISSIPDELKPHFYYIHDESSDGIRSAICDLHRLPVGLREEHGLRAKQFTQSHFSEEAVGCKIERFVKNFII